MTRTASRSNAVQLLAALRSYSEIKESGTATATEIKAAWAVVIPLACKHTGPCIDFLFIYRKTIAYAQLQMTANYPA